MVGFRLPFGHTAVFILCSSLMNFFRCYLKSRLYHHPLLVITRRMHSHCPSNISRAPSRWTFSWSGCLAADCTLSYPNLSAIRYTLSHKVWFYFSIVHPSTCFCLSTPKYISYICRFVTFDRFVYNRANFVTVFWQRGFSTSQQFKSVRTPCYHDMGLN